jgi:uncharacterized membrane protein YqhA
MLRTSLLSGLILDGILGAYLVVTGLVSTLRHWEAAQTKATGMMAMAAGTLDLLLTGLLLGLAGALATYLVLKWTRPGP